MNTDEAAAFDVALQRFTLRQRENVAADVVEDDDVELLEHRGVIAPPLSVKTIDQPLWAAIFRNAAPAAGMASPCR